MSCDYPEYDSNGNEIEMNKQSRNGKFTSGFSFDDASRYCEKLIAVRKN